MKDWFITSSLFGVIWIFLCLLGFLAVLLLMILTGGGEENIKKKDVKDSKAETKDVKSQKGKNLFFFNL
jgi:hypothetical protein